MGLKIITFSDFGLELTHVEQVGDGVICRPAAVCAAAATGAAPSSLPQTVHPDAIRHALGHRLSP